MDTNITTLRKALSDSQTEPIDVLTVLLEQGWVTEDGELAPDLEELLPEATARAFDEMAFDDGK